MNRVIWWLLLIFMLTFSWAEKTSPIEQEVKKFRAQLKNANAQVKLSAIHSLGMIGARAHSATDDLIPLLQDKDRQICHKVIETLGKIGPQAIAAAPHLLNLCKNQGEFATAAARSLGKIQAVTLLVSVLTDRDPKVRQCAALALIEVGDTGANAVPALTKSLQDADALVRCYASLALGKIASQADICVPALTKLLADSEPQVRTAAAIALGELGLPAATATAELIKTLKDTELATRAAAAQALGRVQQVSAVPALLQALTDPVALVRIHAALALSEIRPASPQTAERLLRQLRDSDAQVRAAVATALAKMPLIATTIEELSKALQDTDPEVRCCAIKALTSVAANHTQIVVTIAQAIQDLDGRVRGEATQALGNLGSKALPTLLSCLQHSDKSVRTYASYALGKIGAEAVAPLRLLLERSDAETLYYVAEALAQIGEPAASAVPRFLALINTDPHKYAFLGDVLVKIGPICVPSLVESFYLTNQSVHPVIIATLAKLHPHGSTALKNIINQEKNPVVVSLACQVLQKIGEPASSFIPDLLACAKRDSVHTIVIVETLQHLTITQDALNYLVTIATQATPAAQKAALRTLALLGNAAQVAIPVILGHLRSNDHELQELAALVLGNIGTAALPELRSLLAEQNVSLVSYAILAISQMKSQALPVADAIIALLKQAKDTNIRANAAYALGQIGADEAIIRALIGALSDPEPIVTTAIVNALANFGVETISFAPRIIYLPETNEQLRQAKLNYLAGIGESVMPALVKMLDDPQQDYQLLALQALARIGLDSQEVVQKIVQFTVATQAKIIRIAAIDVLALLGTKNPAHTMIVGETLANLLNDTDWEIREASLSALGKQQLPSNILPKLIHCLQDKDWGIREQAIEVICSMGTVALPELILALDNSNAEIRTYSILALARYGKAAQPSVGKIVQILQTDPQGEVRSAAAFALGCIDAKTVHAQLRKALQDKDWRVRKAAAEALGK